MPFNSQFALSLELTRLIPVSLITSKTVEVIMGLARDLQGSGSDIVVEHDMASLFGRSRIDSQLASSFRTIVSKTASTKLCEGITLQDGPGPTVTRAFGKDQTPYFATVLQCSLLSFVLEKHSLAEGIKETFEKKYEGASPEEFLRSTPNEGAIFGFIQACEEQTSSYNWSHHLSAVGRTLGYEEHETHQSVSTTILRGLIDMLPLVQHFPENNIIEVVNGGGVCLLVVWAHHVLGLCVDVTRHTDPKYPVRKLFGSGPAQLIINDKVLRSEIPAGFSAGGTPFSLFSLMEPSITLLATTGDGKNEKLFSLERDPDEAKIEAVFNQPAKGYGKRVFERYWSYDDRLDAMLEEMSLITSGYAFAVSENLRKTSSADIYRVVEPQEASVSGESMPSETSFHDFLRTEKEEGIAPCKPDTNMLLNAARFLFNDRKLNQKSISQYATRYLSIGLDQLSEPSERMQNILNNGDTQTEKEYKWTSLVSAARYLSILLLAFAHVYDLKLCEDLPLCYNYEVLFKTKLCQNLLRSYYNPKEHILVGEVVWFDVIASLLVHSYAEEVHSPQPSLLSDRGWSVFLSTFSDTDPGYTDNSAIVIRKGIPCRNGVWKHGIFDASSGDGPPPSSKRLLLSTAGEQATLCCAERVVNGKTLCGERGDNFIISRRINYIHQRDDPSDKGQTLRTGYLEMYQALWTVQKTVSCGHPPEENHTLTLAPGSTTVFGYVDSKFNERLIICLTARNWAARWRVLIGIRKGEWSGRKTLLRREDCCFRCAIAQTAVLAGKWYLVL